MARIVVENPIKMIQKIANEVNGKWKINKVDINADKEINNGRTTNLQVIGKINDVDFKLVNNFNTDITDELIKKHFENLKKELENIVISKEGVKLKINNKEVDIKFGETFENEYNVIVLQKVKDLKDYFEKELLPNAEDNEAVIAYNNEIEYLNKFNDDHLVLLNKDEVDYTLLGEKFFFDTLKEIGKNKLDEEEENKINNNIKQSL